MVSLLPSSSSPFSSNVAGSSGIITHSRAFARDTKQVLSTSSENCETTQVFASSVGNTNNSGVRVRLAAVSLNLTAMNSARNLRLIKEAIDRAVECDAGILAFSELTMTAYDCGANFGTVRNAEVIDFLNKIADYAEKKNPNLVIFVGHPYNKSSLDLRNSKPHICYSALSHGRIQGMQTKTHLAENIGKPSSRGVEYEPHHFSSYKSVSTVTYTDSKGEKHKIKYGDIVFSPSVKDEQGNIRNILVYTPICESAHVDMLGEKTRKKSSIVTMQKSLQHRINVVIIPVGSPHAPGKIETRAKLVEEIAGKVNGYAVYVNGLGSSAASLTLSGDVLYASPQQKIESGPRYSFLDSSFCLKELDISNPIKPSDSSLSDRHVVKIEHSTGGAVSSSTREKTINLTKLSISKVEPETFKGKKIGGKSIDFADLFPYLEEQLLHDALYAYDYLRKIPFNRYFISLSGGADSAYSLMCARLGIEIAIRSLVKEKGFKAGLEAFQKEIRLDKKYAKEYSQYVKEEKIDEIIKLFSRSCLSTAYLRSNNSSSSRTQKAAEAVAEQCGADFCVYDITAETIMLLIAKMGINYDEIIEKSTDAESAQEALLLYGLVKEYLKASEGTRHSVLNKIESLLKALVKKHGLAAIFSDSHMGFDKNKALSWSDSRSSLPLENLQARVRCALNWVVANHEGAIPTSNPNLDETIEGYTTFAGDLHAGTVSFTSHRHKAAIQLAMKWMAIKGLGESTKWQGSIGPWPAFDEILKIPPSAELKPLANDGKITQTDESSFGSSYIELYFIHNAMLTSKSPSNPFQVNTFEEAFNELRNNKRFFCSYTDDQIVEKLEKSYSNWSNNHFKRRTMPVGTVSENGCVDSNTSLRLRALQHNSLDKRVILLLKKATGNFNPESFERLTGLKYSEIALKKVKSAITYGEDFQKTLRGKLWDPKNRRLSLQYFRDQLTASADRCVYFGKLGLPRVSEASEPISSSSKPTFVPKTALSPFPISLTHAPKESTSSRNKESVLIAEDEPNTTGIKKPTGDEKLTLSFIAKDFKSTRSIKGIPFTIESDSDLISSVMEQPPVSGKEETNPVEPHAKRVL